jgi:hypothetical protein
MSSIYDETLYNIILNESNLVVNDASKTSFTFNFAGSKQFQRAKISLSSVSLFYSWFNITEEFGNQTFSFTFTDGTGVTTYNVTIPDGYYSVTTLNEYLQNYMISQGLFLVDASGNYVYYLEFIENPTYYAVQFNAYPFPTALPAGYSNPNGLTFPATATTPALIVNSQGFADILGFTLGTYPNPTQATVYSKLSDTTPRLNPVDNIVMRCNLLRNNISNPPDILYSLSAAGTAFGDLITDKPNELLWIDINEGFYNSITISFVDQEFRPVKFQDSSVIIQLSFRELK